MTTANSFVHLHVHTEFSLLDGAIRIGQMLDKAAALGMSAVAVTDHGNMFGTVQFSQQAAKAGIKPVIGCEVYLAPGDRRDRSPAPDGSPSAYHLILLVTNPEGYRNLCRLVTLGHLEGFYYHPRVDMALLREHNQGLIALSACLKGIVPHLIQQGRMEAAREKALELAAIFDHDRFFLEVQANRMPEQVALNRALRAMSDDLSLPLAATNDCHYLNRADAEAHDVLLCIQTGKTLEDEKRMRFPSDEFYFKSQEEMAADLPGFEDALSNTAAIAGRCDFELELGHYKYPVFHLPEGQSLEERVTEDAEKGLESRLTEFEAEGRAPSADLIRAYRERLDYELGIIKKMGFAGYFLIVADFIEYARRKQIPVGPGRGSAAGSLAAYCLRITNIDPIRYGLLFERFLNPQRISMPDIDIDFCINGREEVIQYVTEKYGRDNVGQIITFGTMKARAAIRDVGRSLNIPLKDVDRIAKLVPEGPRVTLEQALTEEPELRKLEQSDPAVRKLLAISRSLEGLSRHASTHASGVVISDRPLVEYLPLFKGARDEIMTQFTMDRIEQLGLIKFDFLGLKTLTVIRQALDLIEQTTGQELDLDKIPLDDLATYQLCCEGKTTGVFQLESSGMKELLRRLKPGVFEDMVALVALYRPGPLGSNMVEDFINGKHGHTRIHYALPQLEPILKETYGVILYQEQVMKIAQVLADYSLAEADELRKAIGKKKVEVMAQHQARFTEGAARNGVNATKAENLFSLIEKFGGYGFNKSHSAAYALIAYQTAYLKAHFPVEFMAALLTQDMGNQDKTIKNIAECREMGIQILPPDINESQADFSVNDGRIRFGLAAVKNVGIKAVEVVIDERRNNGPFTGLSDFCRRVENGKVSKRVIECLIQCGAFDFTGQFRSRLFAGIEDILKRCGRNTDPNQLSIFAALEAQNGGPSHFEELPEIDEWSEKERLALEKEALGFYITGHPLDRFRQVLERVADCTVQGLAAKEDKSLVKIAGVVGELKLKRTRKGDRMAVFQLEDLTGSTEVVLFPEAFARCSSLLKGDDPILVCGPVEIGESSAKIVAQEVEALSAARQRAVRAMAIHLEEKEITRPLIEDLRNIAFRYPGSCRLLFAVTTPEGGEIRIAAHERFRVQPCPELLGEIETLVGIGHHEFFFDRPAANG